MNNISKSLHDCQIGSILAEDLVNDKGFIILKKNTILTEKTLESLSKLGINNLVIQSITKITPAELQEKMEKIEKRINKRMRRCEMTNEMKILKDILVEYFSRNSIGHVEE